VDCVRFPVHGSRPREVRFPRPDRPNRRHRAQVFGQRAGLAGGRSRSRTRIRVEGIPRLRPCGPALGM